MVSRNSTQAIQAPAETTNGQRGSGGESPAATLGSFQSG